MSQGKLGTYLSSIMGRTMNSNVPKHGHTIIGQLPDHSHALDAGPLGHLTSNVGAHSHSIHGGMQGHDEWNPIKMIAMRMRLSNAMRLPFDFINAHDSASCVYVFVVVGGKAHTIEDDKTMFPSDGLMAKLLLLIG